MPSHASYRQECPHGPVYRIRSLPYDAVKIGFCQTGRKPVLVTGSQINPENKLGIIIVAVGIAGVMTAGLLSGCGASEDTQDQSDSTAQSDQSADETSSDTEKGVSDSKIKQSVGERG